MDNYEELEGKAMVFHSWNEDLKGIVIGCDYDIGITIVAKDNPNRYLLCLHGESSPQWNEHANTKESYKKYFDFIINQIKTGTFNLVNLEMFAEVRGQRYASDASHSTCPFGQ